MGKPPGDASAGEESEKRTCSTRSPAAIERCPALGDPLIQHLLQLEHQLLGSEKAAEEADRRRSLRRKKMAMAAELRAAAVSSLLPRFSSPNLVSSSRFASIYAQQLSIPFLPAFSLAVPAIQLNLPSLPSLLQDIWGSILKAVPKKKTSHMKKRHRQMAGKALRDVTSLCKCPACGRVKRMHYLCPWCLKSLQEMMRKEYPIPPI